MASPYLIQQADYALRLLEDQPADYNWLAKWLTDPVVLAYYEGRDNPFPLARVRKKYEPRVQRLHPTVPCFMLDRDQPIGYLQYYPLSVAERTEFDLLTAAKPFGMDLFIGEPAVWNRGLGTIFVQLAVRYLTSVCDVTHITIDPHVDNHRAIRCYSKGGFEQRKLLPQHEYHEGAYCDSWLMLYTRPAVTG